MGRKGGGDVSEGLVVGSFREWDVWFEVFFFFFGNRSFVFWLARRRKERRKGKHQITYRSGSGSLNEFRLSFRLIRTVTMMMSSSLGGLAGSRSNITPALRKPPTERVRTGCRAGVWLLSLLLGWVEAWWGVSWGGIVVVVVVVAMLGLGGVVVVVVVVVVLVWM